MQRYSNKYRIIQTSDHWYSTQLKKWWLPFWIRFGSSVEHIRLKDAENSIRIKANKVVKSHDDIFPKSTSEKRNDKLNKLGIQ